MRRPAPAENQAIETPDPTYLLAIESGGSGTRLALARASGEVVHLERCGSGSPLYRHRDDFAIAFDGALARTLAAVDTGRGALCAAGLAGPADRELILEALHRVLPEIPVQEFSEGDLARSLHDVTAGVALVAGTGCSCSAVDEQGTLTSLGGYGPQFGDEGSGYWIGREGVKAAFLAEQGRTAPTALLPGALAFYAISSPWEIHREAEGSGHVPAPRVAAFAAAVDDAAEAGDARAAGILDEAGAHLGRLILDTVRHAELAFAPVPLVMTGGVLRSRGVLASISRTLAADTIAFKHYPVAHEPIAGLIKLLQRRNEPRNAQSCTWTSISK